jgi:hypothetical protein
MAKLFYTAAEAAEKLGTDENGVKELVKEGKLREFRDAGTVNYKVDDVDKVAAAQAKGKKPVSGEATARPRPADSGVGGGGGSSAAEIILEPAEGPSTEESSIELAAGSDILSLEDEDTGSGGTSALTAVGGPKSKDKSDTAVPSVGVNVFDDDDLDEHVDPLAQTAVTDVAGLGLEGLGAGSGIMDLTRESDDTSLGRELLDEIYTDETKEKASAEAEDTKAGLEVEAVPDTADEDELAIAAPARSGGARAAALDSAEMSADPVSLSLTAMMAVAVVVMWFAGLGAAALVRGITPTIFQWLYDKLMFAAIGAVVAGLAAAGITYLVSKRSAG